MCYQHDDNNYNDFTYNINECDTTDLFFCYNWIIK